MRKAILLAACCLLLALLTACGADPEAASKATTPTGYPKGQIQNDCVRYQCVIYWRGAPTQKSSAMKEVGEVGKVDNYRLPSEDFEACHLKKGDKILVIEEGDTVRLFVQRTDVNRLEEFFCAEEDNTKESTVTQSAVAAGKAARQSL